MIRRTAWFVGAIVIMANVGGCGIGYNRVLFGTKTNVGFDVDTKPPVVQLNINRKEGVIAPQFENGKKLPVLASFRFQNSKSFSPSIGSAFATGDAAVTLAALYDGPTPANGYEDRLELVQGELMDGGKRSKPVFDSSLILDEKPTISDNAAMLFAEKGSDGEYFQQTDVRPVFFGTDTSLGLKIGWSGAGPFPDSAKLGFNRKELAWVPVSIREKSLDGKTKHLVKTSSLLATIDSAISQPTLVDGAPQTDIQYVQYFATGEAATLLALQQDVRQAMLVRLDPNQQIQKQRFIAGLAGDAAPLTMNLLYGMYRFLTVHSDEDQDSARLIGELDSVGDGLSIPESLVFYGWEPPDLENIVAQPALRNTVDKKSGFSRVKHLMTLIDLSIGTLTSAGDDTLITVDGTEVPARQIVEAQRAYRTALLKELSNSPAIIKAIDHFNKLLISTKPEGD